MKTATKNLPEDFQPVFSIDLSKEVRILFILNLAGLGIMAVSFLLLGLFASLARPELKLPGLGGAFTINMETVLDLLRLLLVLVFFVLIHELIHGFFFWLFTHSIPRFGLGPSYAYAAAPEWYIPTRQYLVVGLAPLVLIALGCLWVIGLGPRDWVLPAIFVAAFNTGGAVGDIWIIGRLLLGSTKNTLVNDNGHRVTFFDLRA